MVAKVVAEESILIRACANVMRCGSVSWVFASSIANRLKNDYILCPDMRQRSIAGCYQNNVAWLYIKKGFDCAGIVGDMTPFVFLWCQRIHLRLHLGRKV